MKPKPLSAEKIVPEIGRFRFGQHWEHRRSVVSTNTLAKEMVLGGHALPLIVTAEEQAGGKGRLQRSWFSPLSRGIWMTVAFPPGREQQIFGHYNFLFSLVIASAVESVTGLELSFKWPNDILSGGRKICGILAELISRQDGGNVVIIGAGINTSVERSGFPREIRDTATSIFLERHKEVDRDELFIEIIQSLDTLYAVWEQKGIEPIYYTWLQKCTTTGKKVGIETPNRYISGTAEKISQDGSLQVRGDDEKIHTIFAGDLSYRIEQG